MGKNAKNNRANYNAIIINFRQPIYQLIFKFILVDQRFKII